MLTSETFSADVSLEVFAAVVQMVEVELVEMACDGDVDSIGD